MWDTNPGIIIPGAVKNFLMRRNDEAVGGEGRRACSFIIDPDDQLMMPLFSLLGFCRVYYYYYFTLC